MKLLYLPLLVIFYVIPTAVGPIEKVAELIRQGNVSELSKMFAANVEISMQSDDNVYSKVQAGLILDKFFSQNKPISVKIFHKVNSNPKYQFAVIILNTQKGPFRITYTLKDTDGTLVLIELLIEPEKVK
ncbi:DUF4783 domain-containing protein [Mucilaginibacter flavidus]|uniref:DUF4783 domain-containing protein n=1 Tax=Mucilaginibacter flavidus TaxID=2949309 RepID=UPI002092A56D|nr:DUF4783 domain-containing protein [Mucilaginibacter flavidus]MCO5945457.1 DUF4783 domain-containing protein [Mucilaginibacter flavidus]